MSIFFTDQAEFQVDEVGADFLKGTLTLSKVGVYDYRVGGVMVKKAKLPEDLFSAATRVSANLAPITDGHPLDADGEPMLVKPDNYRDLVRGTIGKPWVDGEFLRAPAMVYDAQLQKEIKSGEKKEASIGFLTEDDATPGSYHGEAYDSAQRDMRVNHAAIVRAGRAGEKVNFHVDMKEDGMLKFRNDEGKELVVDGADASPVHALLTSMKQARDAALLKVDADGKEAETKAKDLQTKIDELEKKIKTDEPEKVTQLEEKLRIADGKLENANDAKKKAEGDLKKVTDARPGEIHEAAKARGKLEADAKAAGIEGFEVMGDRQVMEQIIAKHMPYKEGVNVDEKTDETIAERCELIGDSIREKANEVGAAAPGGQPAVTADAITDKRRRLGNWQADQAEKRAAAGK